ncbi:NYN domain-containing protein, partial [Campylobacter jejuni]|nr:NYN domain-containing protein [Campylobacter jejuni]ECH5615052.1 NYN domain-containing protein [Campylobacter jejuni]EGJ2119673.1 NYN domain-containing protein [Campylobacter jejuni]EGO3160587.1 NYN domain-containing protein [Campylobacter jejuni]EHC5564222.1 NYN domain-containing protein [Campylobacter jejuni]
MENKSIAIFIDAENIPAKYAKSIFDIASDYGEVIIKRIYGDWTQKNIQGWREQIAEYSLIAMQQFNFAANKNSSDMYLITEIMSIFYEKNIDIFVIVSSDSDYTSLIQKLRENKKQVIGMGLEKSIKSYVNAFSEF